jgi:hypothetical protein
MTELTEKEALLEGSGYRYHFDRMIYSSRASRRALSLEFVEDNASEKIQHLIDEKNPTDDWIFHFTQPASDRVKRELAEALAG